MKRKEPSEIQRLTDEVRKLREELAKRPSIVVMPPQPIIIKLPRIGEDDGPGNPVPYTPWRPTPHWPTVVCGETRNDAATGVVTWISVTKGDGEQ